MLLSSRDEIILANRIFQIPPDELMTWYKFFGGVARWVFDTEQEIHGNSVQEAAQAQTSSRKLTRLEQVTFSSIISHIIYLSSRCSPWNPLRFSLHLLK